MSESVGLQHGLDACDDRGLVIIDRVRDDTENRPRGTLSIDALPVLLLHALILLLFAAPLSADKLSWQQEAPVNPSTWTYRLYADIGPYLIHDVVCTGNPPEFDCSAPFPIAGSWDRAYLTVENSAGESLPSNPIYSATPIELVTPAPPKNLKRVP